MITTQKCWIFLVLKQLKESIENCCIRWTVLLKKYTHAIHIPGGDASLLEDDEEKELSLESLEEPLESLLLLERELLDPERAERIAAATALAALEPRSLAGTPVAVPALILE